MDLNELSTPAVWSIMSDAIESMRRRTPSSEEAAKMAIRFTETPTQPDDFMLRDGVAIIPVTGPIFKRGSFWSLFYGGTPLIVLNQIFSEAVADPDVQAILLDIDSPGGQVSGTNAFSDLVYQARQKKPVVAFANGLMASGAYWIGSAADKIVVERTAQVGSIGVLYVHNDLSRFDFNLGLKRTVIASGKYKAVGNNAQPLSDADRAIIQAELDEVYGLFIDAVARNRGAASGQVKNDMADGRVFIGQKAVDAGLADVVGSFEDAFSAATAMIPGQIAVRPAPGVKKPVAKVQHPQTQNSDVERIMGLLSLHFGEAEASRFQDIVNSGVTPEQYRALGVPSRSRENRELEELNKVKDNLLQAIKDAGSESPGAGAGMPDSKDFMAVVEETMVVEKIGKTDAMQMVVRQQPELHKKYLQRHNPGMTL